MDQSLTIQIVGWNSAAVLPAALNRLKLCPKEIIIRYIDNNSADGSVETVKGILPDAHIIELDRNAGFAAAHNIGFKHCTTRLVMLHNPDLVLDLGSLPKLTAAFEEARVGAVQGKILKGKNNQGKDIIDSTGVVMTLPLSGADRGEGEIDAGQYNQSSDVAAVTGAGGCYRMAALHNIRDINGQIFDEDFFAYKEDVDLGWRLRHAGWVCKYIPVLQGIHPRGFGRKRANSLPEKMVYLVAKVTDQRTRYSLRNWIWMILKNSSVKDALKHELFVDLRIFGFVLLSTVYWPMLATWIEIIKGVPKIIRKRVDQAGDRQKVRE
jgi:GT2 family glycosyltransferase